EHHEGRASWPARLTKRRGESRQLFLAGLAARAEEDDEAARREGLSRHDLPVGSRRGKGPDRVTHLGWLGGGSTTARGEHRGVLPKPSHNTDREYEVNRDGSRNHNKTGGQEDH